MENLFSGVKFAFSAVILLILVQQIVCEKGDHIIEQSRAKREYSSPYGSSGYPGGNEKCMAPICKPAPHCLPLASIPNQNKPEKINNTWLAIPRQFYITVGSCWGYSLYAKIFNGRDVLTEKELTELCFTQFFSNDGLQSNNGFGQQWWENCTSHASDPGQDCVTIPGSGSDGTDLSLQTMQSYYLILTDSKTFALYYRCVDGRYGDYQLATTTPFVEMSTAKAVIDLILEMGVFDLEEVRFLPCTAPSYPCPFQNYLNSQCSYSSSSSTSCSANSYPSAGNYNNNNAGPPYNSQYSGQTYGESYRPPAASPYHYPPNY